MNTTPSKGFVFLAYGDRFVKEAAVSARSIRRLDCYPITLFTDKDTSAALLGEFDQIIVEPLRKCYSDKILIEKSPYDLTIFLDTDTIALESYEPIFGLLSAFDVAVQFTEGGNHYVLPGVPMSFYEPSAGILAWRACERSTAFFKLWREWYTRIEKEQGVKGAWDQRSLRAALYHSDVRITPLATEFQFYTYRPNIVAGKVTMVHGRNLSSRMLSSISSSDQFRLWIPKVGACPVMSYATMQQMVAFAAKLILRIFVITVRRFLAWTRLYPLPKNSRPA